MTDEQETSHELKTAMARAQLGTALDLFTRDRDPVSVHVLSCGAGEVLDGLATARDVGPFSKHILATQPELEMADIKRLRNQYWNAMKHFYGRDNKTVRHDEELLRDFSDTANDTSLFLGWHDYQAVVGALPIQAQVFQVWYYALNEAKLAPGVDLEHIRSFFPGLIKQERREQKRRLRRACERYREDKELLADPKTEIGPLSRRRS
jgi:hypothetical protein